MRSKATLVMIEQVVMVLVFALAATLCVQMFVLTEKQSKKYEATDRAVLEAQNMAETLKSGETEGITEGTPWCISFDSEWKVTEDEAQRSYYLEVHYTEEAWLWKAEVIVFSATGTELYRIPVAGQKQTEVTAHETF